MILDATAGNRTMWQHKNSPNIIYIDTEKKLEVPPTIFASNENTPFHNNQFDAIFYDPPHNWNVGDMFFNVRTRQEYSRLYHKIRHPPTYYGLDQYKTRNQLVKHIYNAQKEFQRILKPDGLLWFKWNEKKIRLHRILGAFADWQILMTLYIQDPQHGEAKFQTYWVCMQKKEDRTHQQPLLNYL